MLKKTLLAALALTASSAAFAHDGWHHGRAWGHRHFAPRAVVVVPAPRVAYAPPPPVVYPYYAAPVVVRPAPVYAPAPVVVPAPVYPAAPGVSIRFNIPL